jgi:DNA-binding transcriptional ArsR family regulator
MAARKRLVEERSSLPDPAEHVTVAALAKALGHPARVGILAMLHERQTCIGCDIVDEIGLAQSTTAEHLRILRAAGIITGEIERPRVCYSLNPDSLLPLASLLNSVLGQSNRGERGGSTRAPAAGRKAKKSSNRLGATP